MGSATRQINPPWQFHKTISGLSVVPRVEFAPTAAGFPLQPSAMRGRSPQLRLQIYQFRWYLPSGFSNASPAPTTEERMFRDRHCDNWRLGTG